MAGRPRHPKKEIEAAVAQLEALGWTWKEPGKSAHAWGRMLCPQNDRTDANCLSGRHHATRKPMQGN